MAAHGMKEVVYMLPNNTYQKVYENARNRADSYTQPRLAASHNLLAIKVLCSLSIDFHPESIVTEEVIL